MNDLIKRIDDYLQGAGEELSTVILTDCKAALEAKGEPVAYRHWCECDMDEDGNPVYDWEYFDKASCSECQPLYTTPPSVDELIAEIDGLERIDFDEGGCDYPCSAGNNYSFDDVRAVLNKYRSAK